MQAAIKFANACEFDHRKAFHIPHFDFFEESASASPMLFNGSASADRGRVSDKSNSAMSLTQGLSAPLKLSKTRRLAPEDPSRRLTLCVTAAASDGGRRKTKKIHHGSCCLSKPPNPLVFPMGMDEAVPFLSEMIIELLADRQSVYYLER